MEKVEKAYICSPLSAPTQEGIRSNMLLARQHMEAISRQYGYRTYAPHAYLPELLDENQPEERALALSFGKELLKRCQILIVCGNRISGGMCEEICAAASWGKTIYFCSPKDDYRMTLFIDGRQGV